MLREKKYKTTLFKSYGRGAEGIRYRSRQAANEYQGTAEVFRNELSICTEPEIKAFDKETLIRG